MQKQQTVSGEQSLMVVVRIRPINEDEILAGATVISHKVDDSVVVLMDPLEDPDDVLRMNRSRERQFVYDDALDASATQEDTYLHSTRFLIDHVIKGYNATVFAYGATGAGKTHTMLGTDRDPGVMFRAMEDLFMEMERCAEENLYQVTMSYLEIYNEMIRDLLNPTTGYLELREDAKGVQVAGLSEVQAGSTQEVMQMLTRGNLMRTTEPTAANKTSSRSHAVLQIIVRQSCRIPDVSEEVRVGRLFLIDLAGSERAANTHNRGKRMVEGAHINRSLLALGNCINALSDPNGKRYVNYRDSKLTRLLKDALGGNCKTVMIAHVSPASFHFEESRNTLVYADRAKHIKTKVRRNVVDVNYHIAQYSNIIAELRQEIFRLRNKLQDTSVTTSDKSKLSKSKRSELNALKEQLLSSFQEQMELRHRIIDMKTQAMDLHMQSIAYKQTILRWESEKILRLANREEKSDSSKMRDQEKRAELQGLDGLPDPDDVVAAKGELKALQEEQMKVEKTKANLEKELQNSRVKAKKMEEILPEKISTEEHKEILSLLCRVHEIEIENTELQTENLIKEHEIRKRELVITQFRNHRQLCEEIIGHQRQLLTQNLIDPPKDLEILMDLYQQEMIEPSLQIAPSAKETERSETTNLEEDKVFSKSPKTKHIQEAKRLEEVSGRSNSLSRAMTRADDVIGAGGEGAKPTARAEMTINTRGIAALAAERRHRLRKESMPLQTSNQIGGSHSNLSTSRLDKYARFHSPWGSLPHVLSDDNLSIMTPDRQSVWTDTARPPVTRPVPLQPSGQRGGPSGQSSGPNGFQGSIPIPVRRTTRTTIPLNPKQGDLQLNSTNPQKANGLKPGKKLNIPNGNRQKRKESSYAAIYENKAFQELETASQTSSVVYQIGSEKGNGLSVQKTLRGPVDINRSKDRQAAKKQIRKPQLPQKKMENGDFVQPMMIL